MFRHINRHFFHLTVFVLQCRLAGQLKVAMRGQRLFDPVDGAANGTFGTAVIDGDVLHCPVFSVVLQGNEQFIAHGEVGRFAAGLVQFVVGNLQDTRHPLENRFWGADDPFELFIRQVEGFWGAFHDFFLDPFHEIGYTKGKIAIPGMSGKIKNKTRRVMEQL